MSPQSVCLPFSEEEFVSRYWQKAPVLMKNVLPDFRDPLTKWELIELSKNENVMSRLIVWHEGRMFSSKTGPFTQSAFDELEGKSWTLFIDYLERHDSRAASLLDHFSFIPFWRFEDVIVTYSTNGAGLGPHFDFDDALIIQGSGEKDWRYQDQKINPADYPGIGVPDIRPTHRQVARKGDVLYMPPKTPHFGQSIGESLTFSLGYRAIAKDRMRSEFFQDLYQRAKIPELFTDERMTPQSQPGEISEALVQEVKEILQQTSLKERDVAEWLGRWLTRPRFEEESGGTEKEEYLTPQDFRARLESEEFLVRRGSIKFLFVRGEGSTDFFAQGEQVPLNDETTPLAILLTKGYAIPMKEVLKVLNPESLELLYRFYQGGYFSLLLRPSPGAG